MSSNWKEIERRVAAKLGGERVPITGRIRGSAPDVEHGWLSIEVKHRRSLPDWLHDAMDQAVKSKRTPEHMPLVILHEHRQKIDDAYCVIKLADLVDYFMTEDRGGE